MAGLGSRFEKAGYKEPKPLIPVDGEPMIHHVIRLFSHPTINSSDFVFICNNVHLATTNIREVLLAAKPDAKILGIDQHKKGPVYTVTQVLDQIFVDQKDLDDDVIVSYCDYGTNWNFDKFINMNTNKGQEAKGVDGSIVCYRGFHPHMLGKDNYAFIKMQITEGVSNDGSGGSGGSEGSKIALENSLVAEVREKQPFTNNRMQEFASNGTYYFSKGLYVSKYFKELMDKEKTVEVNGEYYVSLVYNLMIQDNLKVNVFEIQHMLQWGTPYDLSVYQMWSNYFKNRNNYTRQIRHPKGTTLVLPLAGRGNRFAVQGFSLPKPMLPVDNEIMVVQAARSLPDCDRNIFICLEEHIKDYGIDKVLKSKFNDVSVLSINEVTQGQACTCEIAVKDLDPELPICITACDNGVIYNEVEYEKLLNDESVDVIVWSFRKNPTSLNNPHMYAWLTVGNDKKDSGKDHGKDHGKENDDNCIQNVSVKKCPFDDPLNRHAIIGTMFFRKAKYFMQGLKTIYEKNIRTNGEFYVDDLLNPLISQGLKIKVFESDFYVCWGTPDDYKTFLYWKDYHTSCSL